MRLRDFKEGKIAVWAETKADAEQFMHGAKTNNIKWKYHPYEATDATANCEYAYGFENHLLSRATNTRGWFSRQNVPRKPYKSITVAEFFEDGIRFTLEDFKAGKVVATFQAQDKEGRKAFLNRPELASIKRCDHLDTCGNNTVIYMNAAKGKLCSSLWQVGDLPSVPYTGLLPPDYSFEAFKRGKYAVAFVIPKEDDPVVKAFVASCIARGVDTSLICDENLRPGVYYNITARRLNGNYGERHLPNVSASQCPWINSVPDEQITAYRNPDGTVTATYTKDGKVVKSATVKRYYKDTDDLPTAAKHALEKMLGEPREYKVGDKVRVHYDASRPSQHYPTIGVVVDISPAPPVSYRCDVLFPDGEHDYFSTNEEENTRYNLRFKDYILGLAQTPKEEKPVDYKPGDLVRVRDDLVVGVKYGDDKFVDSMLNSLGKILRLGRKSSCRNAFNLHGWNYTPEMFSGLVTPTPPFDKDGKPNYRAGQKIKIRWCENTRVVPIAQVDSTAYPSRRTEMHYSISNPDGSAHWILDNSVIGLADETEGE